MTYRVSCFAPLLLAVALVLVVPKQASAAPALTFAHPILGQVQLPARYERFDLPIARWQQDHLPVQALEGLLTRQAWQLQTPKASLLDVMAPLRDQFVAAGYEVVLDCAARDCGGFDFRFAIEVLPEPQMHVDLNEYQYVSLRKGQAAASLLVGSSGPTSFVQLITLTPAKPGAAPVVPQGQAEGGPAPAAPLAPAPTAVPIPPQPGATATGLRQALDRGLSVALDDLVFASGTSALTEADYASLKDLAAWLAADPKRKLFLVGHTDLSGALPNNIALSEKRAQAVRTSLMAHYGIDAARLVAQGVGPLVPRASNADEAGRQINRRVEAVPAAL